jgi:Fibronectin type III domain
VVSPTEVELSWQDRATDETEYRVEVRTVDGEFEDVGAVGAGSTVAYVQGLAPATGYVFRVRAGRLGIHSAYSNEARAVTGAVPGPCVADVTTVCLLEGRFSARVVFKVPGGPPRHGIVMPIPSGGSGLFWLTSPEAPELLVRMEDGCADNGRFWLYTGPATNLEFVLTVIDTETGKVRVYFNPPGAPAVAVADPGAFGGCR